MELVSWKNQAVMRDWFVQLYMLAVVRGGGCDFSGCCFQMKKMCIKYIILCGMGVGGVGA